MRFSNLLLLCLLALSSCFAPKSEDEANIAKKFFSLKEFFTNEAIRLDSQNLHIRRTVRVNNDVSEALDSFPNWTNEFQLLKNFDINKSALLDDYKIDSVVNDNQKHYFYENISQKQSVRLIHIYWTQANIPDLIEVTAIDESYFKQEEFLYSYQPSKAYGVVGYRKSIFSGKKEFEILCEIVTAD